MARRKRGKLIDEDGKPIVAGCTIRFSYGIPPVVVVAEVVERGGVLVALTPGHTPASSRVDEITPFFTVYRD